MLISQKQFEDYYYPLVKVQQQSTEYSSLYISKKGNIVKQRFFSLDYWQTWENYFAYEIKIQTLLHEKDQTLFLGIKNWAVQNYSDQMQVSIIYENIEICLNIKDFLQSSFYSEDKISTYIINLLRIDLQLQKYGIYHFNITPNNIIYMNGMLKLSDFSSARMIHDYYFSKLKKESQTHNYYYYQSNKILTLKQLLNQEDKDQMFLEITNNQILFQSIFQKNDEWAISLIIAQLVIKNFSTQIKMLEDFYCFNLFNLKNLLKQVKNINPIYYPLCQKLLEQKLDLKTIYDQFLEQQQFSTKSKKNQVKPLLIRLDPIIEQNISDKQLNINQLDYFYISFEQMEKQENLRFSISSCEESNKKLINEKTDSEIQIQTFQSSITKQQSPFQNQNNKTDQSILLEICYRDIQLLFQQLTIETQFSFEEQIEFVQKQLKQDNLMRKEKMLKKIKISDINVKCFKENFFLNLVELKFYNQIIIQSQIFSNLCFQTETSWMDENIISYTNENCSYIGQHIDQKPNGIGIQQRKKGQKQFIIGEFQNGYMKNCLVIESLDSRTIQVYYGFFDSLEKKIGECEIEWYENLSSQQTFQLIQQHKGQIKENIICGTGIRKYLKNKDQKQYLYIGEFKNSQKEGTGCLFQISGQEKKLVYFGKFEQDKYQGYGEGFYNNKLKIIADFKKGLIKDVKLVEHINKNKIKKV